MTATYSVIILHSASSFALAYGLLRDRMTFWLERRGLHTASVGSGERLLPLLEAHYYSLAVIDMDDEPGIGGVVLVRVAHRATHGSEIPILAIAADTGVDQLDQVPTAGADAVLAQPLDHEEFHALVRQLVETGIESHHAWLADGTAHAERVQLPASRPPPRGLTPVRALPDSIDCAGSITMKCLQCTRRRPCGLSASLLSSCGGGALRFPSRLRRHSRGTLAGQSTGRIARSESQAAQPNERGRAGPSCPADCQTRCVRRHEGE